LSRIKGKKKLMTDKETDVKNVIESYRKRQQNARKAPLFVFLAMVFLIAGIAFIIFWVVGQINSGSFSLSLFSTETFTPTVTFTVTASPTVTHTPTETPTITPTETATITPTVAGPFIYQVIEGDTCYAIAVKYKVDLLLLIQTNNLTPDCIINPGDQLIIPGPDAALPSATPIPENLPRGTKIEYMVVTGDSLGALAIKFNTTVEAILKENPTIKNDNDVKIGIIIIIPVNLVPTNTPLPPTNTPDPRTPTRILGTPINITPTASATPRP
jgi:LysM repeat protein